VIEKKRDTSARWGLSVTNLQTVWPVAGVEAPGTAEGPNGGRSARVSRMGRGNTRNDSMRVMII
jgi:hypothetical protein